MDSCLSVDEDLDGHSKLQLMHQIIELQTAVNDMKTAFTGAMQQLGNIQYDDQNLHEKINETKAEYQDQIAEVIKLMLSLKSKFCCLNDRVQQIQHQQQSYQLQIQGVLSKQNLLLSELCRSGIISENTKLQLTCAHSPVERTSSGCHSSDSGVALLLEKVHTAFQSLSPSDQDVASVTEISHSAMPTYVSDFICDSQANEYDSDSSLVMAANKSLSLSTSLAKQCGLELDNFDSSSDDGEYLMEDVDSDLAKKVNEYLPPQILKLPAAPKENECSQTSSCKGKSKLLKTKEYRDTQRLQVMVDLLDSEKKYCKTLSILQDTFAEPLKQKNIVSLRDINTMFPEDISYIYEKHCILLHKLEERYLSWKWNDTIADVIVRFINPEETDILRWYTSYVNDFPEVLKTFHKLCRQSGTFTKFLKSCLQQPNCKSYDLGNFLLAPLQRIPNYVLLLKRLQLHTDSNHSDSKLLSTVLNRLDEFLSRLNDSMEHSFQLVTAQINHQTEMENSVRQMELEILKQNESAEDIPVENFDIEVSEVQCNKSSSSMKTPTTRSKWDIQGCSSKPEDKLTSLNIHSRFQYCSPSEFKSHSKFTKCASAANLPSSCSWCVGQTNLKNQRYMSDDMTDGCWQRKDIEFAKLDINLGSNIKQELLFNSKNYSPERNEFREFDEESSNESCGVGAEAINDSFCVSSLMNDLSCTHSTSSPVRPLIKSRSAHAVHEVVEANNQWLDDIGKQKSKGAEKTTSKPEKEKKKISLRTLKNLWFFKKRSNGPTLKTMDNGTYTSHDALFPVINDDKQFTGLQTR